MHFISLNTYLTLHIKPYMLLTTDIATSIYNATRVQGYKKKRRNALTLHIL